MTEFSQESTSLPPSVVPKKSSTTGLSPPVEVTVPWRRAEAVVISVAAALVRAGKVKESVLNDSVDGAQVVPSGLEAAQRKK